MELADDGAREHNSGSDGRHISLAGICLVQLKATTLEGVLDYLVSFAVGGLLGGRPAPPEAVEYGNAAFLSHSLAAIVVFLLMERFLR